MKHLNRIPQSSIKAEPSIFGFRHSSFVILLATLISTSVPAAEPLRALLITGGCCHDYTAQKKILTEGISARANVTWTIILEGEGSDKDVKFSIYEKPDWTKGFDVIVHNECSGQLTNVDWVEHIAKGHYEGVPAVVIHCSMHSYRFSPTDEWRKLLGVSSYRHQAFRPFEVVNLKPEHPVMKGFPAKWQDDPDELYEIKKSGPTALPSPKASRPKRKTTNTPASG